MNTSLPPATCSGSSLGLLFRQARNAMCARLEHELAAAGHELTFSQYVTLRMLSIGPAGVTDLARFVELNPGAMTRLLDKLEARGFIARVADPVDRRALNIHLTDAGLSMWQDINQCGQRVLERAMTGMSQAERNQLTHLLEQVLDNLSSTGS